MKVKLELGTIGNAVGMEWMLGLASTFE